jgi:hypothetical protein
MVSSQSNYRKRLRPLDVFMKTLVVELTQSVPCFLKLLSLPVPPLFDDANIEKLLSRTSSDWESGVFEWRRKSSLYIDFIRIRILRG